MRNTFVRRITAIALLLPLLFTGALCKQAIPADVSARLKPVALEWWGVNGTEEEAAPLITEYRKLHPNVNITYRRFRFAEYESKLLDAFSAADFQGPDIFAIPSSWTRKYKPKLLPAPATIVMPFKEMRGTIQKELFAELRTTQSPAPSELANLFVDAVAPDAVLNTIPTETRPSAPAVFGLPLSVDTMVTYANRDLLNSAGIPEPRRTWSEFQSHLPRLTRLDNQGKIVQSGASIGTAHNIQRSFDLLSLLMMQNGAVMSSEDGQPRFHQIPSGVERQAPPAEDALLFYTDFANPKKPVYTWNDDRPDSLEAFLQGRTAYFFGYNYHLPIIKARAPRINVSVTAIPHTAAAVDPTSGTVIGSDTVINGQPTAITYANFWLESASARTKYPNEAWDFIITATTKPPIVSQFLAVTGRPTALRSLIAAQLQDPALKVFAAQLLTARTWYHGRGPQEAEAVFAALVDTVLQGNESRRALQVAAEQISQTL